MIRGIDISLYQKRIAWQTVKAQGIQFSFIKASQKDYRDPFVAYNWPAAKDVGMPRGAYHYLQANTESRIQPRIFIHTLAGDWGELPPVIDVEDKRAIDPRAYALLLSDWIETVSEATGRRPMIYTAQWFCQGEMARWIDAVRGDCPLWVASYPFRVGVPPLWTLWRIFRPRLPALWKDCAVWQYSSNGRVAGINSNVDLNVSRLSIDELKAL